MIIRHDSIYNSKYQPLYRRYHVNVHKYHPRQNLVGQCLLAQWLQVPLAQVRSGKLFIHGRFGKPYLRNHAFSFNLTNSKAEVILVADVRPVAVDTEQVRPIDYHRIHRAFSPRELAFLARTPRSQLYRTTLKMWTVKEGVLKQIGTGLNGGARTVQIRLPRMREADRKGKRYQLIPYNVKSDYVGTIVKERI